MSCQLRPRRQRSSATISNLHIANQCNAIDRQKPGVVRCERVLRTRIPKTDDQLHARTTPFKLLLALVRSRCSSIGSRCILLALLRYFGLGRASNRLSHNFFLDHSYVSDESILFIKERYLV